jgi:chemotaxis protein methyltransferase CheR
MGNPTDKSGTINIDINLNLSRSDEVAVKKLCAIAHELTGIQLSDRHQAMVVSRLRKRLIELSIPSLPEYLMYFNAHRDSESPKLVGLLTTHHSYFFREFSHFEFLAAKALPALLPLVKSRLDKKLRVWVAACSRGQEAYSLAMFLDYHLKRIDPSVSFEILGTDIDPEVVNFAKNGVYLRNELKEVPIPMLGDHWAKGTGEIEAYVKAKKSLRDRCNFRTTNLLELRPGMPPAEKFDLVFCRNVFIYFNSDQIRQISNELMARLAPEGYFFVGISESLSNLKLTLESPGPSIYIHKAFHEAEVAKTKGSDKAGAARPGARESVASTPKVIRVLCVDDSPVILTLLKQILTKEEGFEILGTAKNGLEASKMAKELKPDAMTLDIHMPEQTGIEYLERNYRTGHPPVVMVTSVSRDNADLAGRALSLGASDYVEKPALANLQERGEEIRNKLRCAVHMAGNSVGKVVGIDRSFQKISKLEKLEEKIRLIVMPLSSRPKLKALLREFQSEKQPPTLILVDGAKDSLPVLAEVVSKETGFKMVGGDLPAKVSPGELFLVDFPGSVSKIAESHGKGKKVSIMVFGDISKIGAEKLMVFPGAQLLLEDLGSGKGATALMDVANDVLPFTSFPYLSNEYFATGVALSKNAGARKKAG